MLDRAVADEAGRPSRPYRAIDTLLAMERRGSITAAMRQAGEDFRMLFRRAQLDPLRAANLARVPVAGAAGSPSESTTVALERLWLALARVGGLSSPAGSVLWHVVGLEGSLKEWATERNWSGRRIDQSTASGILIAASACSPARRSR